MDGLAKGKRLFVFGHLIYADTLGQRHTRGFGFGLTHNGCVGAGRGAYYYSRTESENGSINDAGSFRGFGAAGQNDPLPESSRVLKNSLHALI